MYKSELEDSLALAIGEITELPIILCIGSDRVTGDCFGPIVGDILKNIYKVPTFIYGCLNRTVTALNLIDTLLYIKGRHFDRKILAVDSALGNKNAVGEIKAFSNGIFPGLGVGKKLPLVGDYSLTATVAEQDDKDGLYSVKLGFITSIAKTAAEAIRTVLLDKEKFLLRASIENGNYSAI